MRPDQTTTMESLCPTFYVRCVGPSMAPAKDGTLKMQGDKTYRLQSFSKKTSMSNHLQM